MANAKVRNVEEGLQGHIAKFINFCFRQHAAYFCILTSCKCKRLNCEFGPGVISQMNCCTVGLARLKSMGKLVLPFSENFTAKQRPFQRWWTLVLPFAKNWDWNKKKIYYLLLATSLPRSAMFVELSILESMRKKFPQCAKMRKKIEDWNGKRTHCRILATSLSRLAATSTDRPPLDKFCITFISTPASPSHLIYYFFHPEKLFVSCQKEKNFFICQKEKNFFRSTMAKSCITFISTTASPVLFGSRKRPR